MVSVKGGWMPSGSHRLELTRKRKTARPEKHWQRRERDKDGRRIMREKGGREGSRAREREKDREIEERKRITWQERDRGWNIANHRISILMLRGGAVVNVEGATWRL